MIKKPQPKDTTSQWLNFAHQETLTSEQVDLFKQYCALLLSWNKTINLTTIANESDVIEYHFRDSLQAKQIVDMSLIAHCADVGSGGGFPGIPLAIKYPQLRVTLIEVSAKKIQFLDTIITELNLGDRISIFDQDWRTFLRMTKEDIQLFCARASLQPEELIRMFKPASAYKQAQLLYWASAIWEPSKQLIPYIAQNVAYRVGTKKRRLILLQAIPAP